MWLMPPSYATPTSTQLYQSVIENTADLQGAIVHICTDFIDVGLGSNSLINSKIDKVLTVDLTLGLGETIASWPPATSVSLSLILMDPPPASS